MKRMLKTVAMSCCALAASAADQRVFPIDGDTHVAEDLSSPGDLGIQASGIGTLFLDGDVSAAGTLSMSVLADTFVWGAADSTTYVRGEDILVAPGKSLSAWTVAGGWMAGTSITTPGAASVHRLEYGDGTLSLNMCYMDGNVLVKMRKLVFTDTPEGIVVRSPYKSYKATNDLNTDFDTDPDAVAHRADGSAAGYEICRIDFVQRMDTTWIRPTKSVTANALALGESTQVALAEGASLGTDGVFAGAISGAATSRLAFGPVARAVGATTTIDALNGVTDGSNPRVPALIARNCLVSDIVSVSDPVQGPGTSTFDSGVYFFENNGFFAECQVQGNDPAGSLCKVSFLTLYQKGPDVYGVINKCMWAPKATYPRGSVDYRTLVGVPGVSEAPNNNYPVRSFKVTLREAKFASYTLQGKTTMDGAIWSVRTNALLVVDHAAALPKNGSVTVDGGSLHLLRQLTAPTAFYVGPGGVLAQCCENGLKDDYSSLTIDGGLLALSPVSYSSKVHCDDCGTYVQGLTLANGARITGLPPRVGNALVTWTVNGSSPSFCETGLKLVHSTQDESRFTFDVADVTLDATADFTVSGRIYDMDANTAGTRLVKTGAGTMRWCGASTCKGEVTVSAGTLALGVADAINADQPVVLNGGALAVEAGLATTVSEVSVTADSGLALAAGASLSFAGVAADGWTEGAKLAVTGPDVQQDARSGLRIGTTACLTPARLRAIRYNGLRVRQDEEGWLMPYRSGMVLIFR